VIDRHETKSSDYAGESTRARSLESTTTVKGIRNMGDSTQHIVQAAGRAKVEESEAQRNRQGTCYKLFDDESTASNH
jgi:hypothetical protein